MNNRVIRTALFQHGLKQRHLAEILGCSEASVSLMLRYELSRAEQKKIVAMINESELLHNGAEQNRTLDK